MKDLCFEVHHLDSPGINEVQTFWLRKWNENFQKLIGKSAEPALFKKCDTYYVLRFNGEIGAIMSSARQTWSESLHKDPYYSAWPEAVESLKAKSITNFHRMGMIAAETSLIPKGFKMTRVLIGCGLKYNFANNPEAQAAVSFPRPDTSVYQACLDWGASAVKQNLMMYNAPVNFVVLEKFNLRTYHQHLETNRYTQDLWEAFCTQNARRINSGKPLPAEISCDNLPAYETAS